MSQHELISRLTDLPAQIHAEEEHLLLLEKGLAAAKEHLTLTEDRLLLSGAIDGKNAETRGAQLREQTDASRAAVAELEASTAAARTRVRLKQNEFSAFKAVARLLAAGAE
jgi:hypothetical protein